MSSANEVLNSLVSLEAQIVTYRRLSRELKVHVNTAKQLLAEFHDVHKDRCQATFLVTGTKKSEGGSELSVKLVAGSELDAAQQELDNSYYHVYSVGPRVDVTKEAMVIANVLAGSIQDIAEHCAVGSSVSRVIDSAPVSAPKPATPAAAMSVDKPVVKSEPKPQVSKQEANKQEPTKQAAKKQEPKQQAATPKSKSFFGRSIGAKKSSKKEPESQTSEDSSAQSKPEYSFAESKTDESSVEPAIEESSAQSNPVDSTSSEEKPRVEDMFMDDDDFEMSPVKPKEPQTPNESMDTQTDSDYPCKESSDVEMGDAEDDDSSVRESMQPDESQTSSGRRRVRKRRKISKVKHTKNSRGMLVSQAVDEWESYSESESDSGANAHTSLVKQKADKSNEHKPAVKKPADKGNKAVPQRSILSFFGKSSKQ